MKFYLYCIQPKVVCTFIVQQLFDCSSSFPGLQYRPDRKYQSTMAPRVPTLIIIFSSQQHSHQRSLSSPHACTTQGSIHLHCFTVHRLLNLPSRAPVQAGQELSEHHGSRSSNFNQYHLICITHMQLS